MSTEPSKLAVEAMKSIHAIELPESLHPQAKFSRVFSWNSHLGDMVAERIQTAIDAACAEKDKHIAQLEAKESVFEAKVFDELGTIAQQSLRIAALESLLERTLRLRTSQNIQIQ